MSNVALTRPTAVTGSILTGGKVGVGASSDFLIKVERAQFRFAVPDRETSGDGDAAPAFSLSYWRYDSFRFVGFMPAQSVATFPLANIINTSKNPIPTSQLKFWFGDLQVLTFPTAIINVFDISWGRTDAALGLAMSGKATNSHATWSTS
jgi:hypothetical protein